MFKLKDDTRHLKKLKKRLRRNVVKIKKRRKIKLKSKKKKLKVEVKRGGAGITYKKYRNFDPDKIDFF
jgi:hypothetical protein